MDNLATVCHKCHAGLCECVRYMTGKSHTEEKEFALSVMQHLHR